MIKEITKHSGNKTAILYSEIINKTDMKQVIKDISTNAKPSKKLLIEVRQS
jgi:3-polyprenyl-4-hydroxybenzoate decarboxylase